MAFFFGGPPWIQIRHSTIRLSKDCSHMDVSESSGTPKSSILIGCSIHYKPSILVIPLFLEAPYDLFKAILKTVVQKIATYDEL